MNLTFADPTEWWLEVRPQLEAESWQDSQTQASRNRRASFYLNQLCLGVFLPWFQTEYAPAAVWPDRTALPSIWEMVSGVSLTMAAKRIVLLPTETLDSRELEVPQEWVDIPNWAADYYLAIQLNLADLWVRVWGYTTHQQLKSRADYDSVDRSYSLAAEDLVRDLNVFWNTCQFCPEAATKAALTPLPNLSSGQAEQLIQQLSQPGIGFPRLAVPFDMWGALLAREDWRRELYQQRLTRLSRAAASPAMPLSRWFEHRFEAGWQTIEAFLGTEPQALAASFRGIAAASGANEQRVKLIELTTEPEPQAVVLLMELTAEADGRVGVRAQIHPPKGRRHVPAKLTLAIYSAADELLQSIQSRQQDDYIQLPHFWCMPGTEIRLQVELDGDRFSENFVV